MPPKAVILSAGRGSRMGNRTADRPKSLLAIGGARLLDRQVAALRAAGVDDIAVVTGWQAQEFNGMGLTLFHNARWSASDMTDSLACAQEWLVKGPTVVSYGDIVYTPATVSSLVRQPGEIVLAYDPHWSTMWSQRFADPLDDAETFRLRKDRTVSDIGGQPATVEEVQGQYMGLLKTEPAGWHRIHTALRKADSTASRRDMTAVLAALIAEQHARIPAVAVQGPWYEFDSPADLEAGLASLAELDRLLQIGTSGTRESPGPS